MSLPKEIQNLSESFSSLPGVGPKLSHRIALYLGVSNKNLARSISHSINDVLQNIRNCENCNNVTTSELCEICDDSSRESEVILVVENALDLYSIESTGDFKGRYLVLGGVISPVNGVGPEDLKIDLLFKRIHEESISEIIFGLSPNLEGESTMMFINNELESLGKDNITVSRLAKGIPSGSTIEFMSSQTLSDSLKSRESI